MENIIDSKRAVHLNGSQLKLLAMGLMLIDHIGAFLLYDGAAYSLCRSLGRLAFPIFCFMIAEGAYYTRSLAKYSGRLLAFALISTPPYNWVHGDSWYELERLNVFFTLLFGLISIACVKELAPGILTLLGRQEASESKTACFWVGLPFCVMLYLSAYALNTDYGGYGVIAVLTFYLLRDKPAMAFGTFSLITLLSYGVWFVGVSAFHLNGYDLLINLSSLGDYKINFMAARQFYAVAALIPISLYNGQRGSGGRLAKYLFYSFYPVHLAVLALLQLLLR